MGKAVPVTEFTVLETESLETGTGDTLDFHELIAKVLPPSEAKKLLQLLDKHRVEILYYILKYIQSGSETTFFNVRELRAISHEKGSEQNFVLASVFASDSQLWTNASTCLLRVI